MPVYPASYELDNVISVGAVNDRDYLAYFSNYGDKVDLTANGYNVYSTFVNDGYGVMNGTSMSAAYVTGVAAEIYSESAATTKNRLISSCDMVSTLTDKVNQGRRINYYNAVNGIIVTEIYENTNIDYPIEHENEVKNLLNNFELYDMDPEPIDVCAGSNHSLVLNSFGDVLTYGDDTYKQLGEHYEGELYFMQNAVNGLYSIEKTSSFTNFNLALDSEGSVYSWGENTRFQLGRTTGNSSVPMKVNFLGGDDTVITDISAGGWFSIALDEEGTVWAWGDNTYGQLAQGATGGCLVDPNLVADIIFDGWNATLENIVKISAGKYHALALSSDGSVYGWGRNSNDHCISSSSDFSIPVATVIQGLPSNIVDIEAGDNCSFSLRKMVMCMRWETITMVN